MQQQSPPVSHSSLRYTCPPSTPQPKAPVFAFNIGFYDPGPNEIDPLDCSCLSDDMRNKTSASGDFTVPLHGSTIAQSPLERQRYSSVTHSGLQTPSLSGYTGPPSTPGSTPSPVLLRTSRSSHMRDFRHLHPLRDKQRFTPDLSRALYLEDQRDTDTISSRNRFTKIRRAEQENTPPARTSTSTIRPGTSRGKAFLESKLLPPLPPSVQPFQEAAPPGKLVDALDEKMDIEKVAWEGDDDVNAKTGFSDTLNFDSQAFTPRNQLRRGAVCCALTY